MISTEIINIDEDSELILLHIENFNESFIKQLDENIVQICEGESGTSCELVKSRMVNFLKTKSLDTKIGAVAEFFIHFYLRKINLKQDFRFFNLEEGSIKKGFDGVYSLEDDLYIVESKSGSSTTLNISHLSKIKKAYKELCDYVAGKSEKSKNNPWLNAYNHASHIDVQSKKTVREKIKKLCDLYDQKQFVKIETINAIPSSTIYIESTWDHSWSEDIKANIDEIKTMQAKKIKFLAITNISIKNFYNYIGYVDE